MKWKRILKRGVLVLLVLLFVWFQFANQADLKVLGDLMAEGKVAPFVEKTYPLDQTAAALRYFEEGHARGKSVIPIPATVISAGALTAADYVLATGLVRSVSLTREVNH